MGSKDDKRSKPAAASGAGLLPVPSSAASEPEALSRELHELHERYGDAVEIPERLIELARRVADAYARLDLEGGAAAPAGRHEERKG